MATYLVGDLQGCYNELKALLKKVDFDVQSDYLYLAGDLVARGPDSLKTLQFVKSLGSSAKIVLGNHDLHLLAVHAGIKKVKKSDQLTELLNSPDINELMTWLAQQPLLQKISTNDNNPAYMTHAGISPEWGLNEALQQAEIVHKKLSSPDRDKWLALMYGELPNSWKDANSVVEKFRYSINALTRMRFCYPDGSLEFQYKDTPEKAPENIIPWFELSRVINTTPWVFGHWASLMGHCSHNNVYPLDTGCVWGNHLTMLRWHDKKIFIEQSHYVITGSNKQ
jgi:bis(5'-nucleosyl)-tetraphosphatase (symmetrical)